MPIERFDLLTLAHQQKVGNILISAEHLPKIRLASGHVALQFLILQVQLLKSACEGRFHVALGRHEAMQLVRSEFCAGGRYKRLRTANTFVVGLKLGDKAGCIVDARHCGA